MTYTRPHAACYLNEFFLITFFCIFFSPATFPIIIISFLNIYWYTLHLKLEREKKFDHIFSLLWLIVVQGHFRKERHIKKPYAFFVSERQSMYCWAHQFLSSSIINLKQCGKKWTLLSVKTDRQCIEKKMVDWKMRG